MAARELSCVNLDCRTINGEPAGGVAPVTVPLVLTDSNGGGPLGATNVVFTKVGRVVTMYIESFMTTNVLSNAASYILTDYLIPAAYAPLATTGTGHSLYLNAVDYSQTGGGGLIGDVAIVGAPLRLVFYGNQDNGSFNAAGDSITFFNTSSSYISAV